MNLFAFEDTVSLIDVKTEYDNRILWFFRANYQNETVPRPVPKAASRNVFGSLKGVAALTVLENFDLSDSMNTPRDKRRPWVKVVTSNSSAN